MTNQTPRTNRYNTDWSAAPLRTLIRHIVETHHAYLQRELPALHQLIGRIMQNGSHEPVLPELHRAIGRLKRELELQMRKEETILFPAILDLAATVSAGGAPGFSQFGSVANLSRAMAKDHELSVLTMREVQQLTNDYTCAKNCGPGMPALFQRLAALAADLADHIRLETEILFSRAIDLERGDTQ